MEVNRITQDVRLNKIDEPAANIRYIGRSDSMRATDTDAVWQILRQYKSGDVIVSNYALMGSFTAKWADRATYFPAVTYDDNNPLESGITITGGVSQLGLNIGGKVTEVELVNFEWRPMPAIPFPNRNSIQVQNFSGVDIKINYVPDHSSSFGVVLKDSTERIYMIKDNIIIYGRSSEGSVKIIVEEIA